MDDKLFTSPRWLARLFKAVDASPIPGWLLALLVVVGIAGVHHAAAWRSGALVFGQLNRNLATQGLFVAAIYYWVVLARRAANDLKRFYSDRETRDQDLTEIIADFNSLPELTALSALAIGIPFGYFGYRFVAASAFPVLLVVLPWLSAAVYMFSTGWLSLVIARMIRQASLMSSFYAGIRVDLFKPGPINALAGYGAFSAVSYLLLFYALVMAAFPTFFFTPFGISIQLLSFLTLGLLFFVPLAGINARMKEAKAELLSNANEDLRTVYEQLRAAAQAQDYASVSDLQGPLATLRESRDMIRSIPTWPWPPNTLRALLAPVLFPIIVFIVQLVVTRVLGR